MTLCAPAPTPRLNVVDVQRPAAKNACLQSLAIANGRRVRDAWHRPKSLCSPSTTTTCHCSNTPATRFHGQQPVSSEFCFKAVKRTCSRLHFNACSGRCRFPIPSGKAAKTCHQLECYRISEFAIRSSSSLKCSPRRPSHTRREQYPVRPFKCCIDESRL